MVRSAEADHAAEEAHSVAEAHVEAVPSLTVVVRSLTEEAHTEVARSLMAVALTVVMVAWEVAAKLKVPAHAPQHSSYAVPRS